MANAHRLNQRKSFVIPIYLLCLPRSDRPRNFPSRLMGMGIHLGSHPLEILSSDRYKTSSGDDDPNPLFRHLGQVTTIIILSVDRIDIRKNPWGSVRSHLPSLRYALTKIGLTNCLRHSFADLMVQT